MFQKRIVRTLGALLLLPAFAGAGCSSKQEKNVPITDPATGKVIGHKDAATGNYVFDDGRVIEKGAVKPIPKSEFANAWTESTEAMLNPRPPIFKPKPSMGSGAGVGSSGGGGCTASCWSMSQGGASCTGCCLPAGGNACTCWESCSDKMSSGSSGGT
jgi:hypothetical protein